MSNTITRRGCLGSAIAAFCAAPVAMLTAQNGGDINSTRLSDLPAAERRAVEMYLSLPAEWRRAIDGLIAMLVRRRARMDAMWNGEVR